MSLYYPLHYESIYETKEVRLIFANINYLGDQACNWAAFNEPLRTKNGAVATDHSEASSIGVQILKSLGGNAFDAAIATVPILKQPSPLE